MLSFRVICLCIAFYSCSSGAATITIDDSAGCSLRQGVVSANSDTAVGTCDAGNGADILQLAASTNYDISNSTLMVTSDITIQGRAGSIINKDASTGIAHRLFTINGASASLSLVSLELYSDYVMSISGGGGCIHVGPLAALTLNGVVVSLCLSDVDGGAIYIADTATATLINSTVQQNIALGSGGGIYAAGVFLDISDASTVSGNTADEGGGIFLDGSTSSLTLKNSSIYGNTSTNAGGGIVVSGATAVVLNDSTITGNDAGSDGAGIALINATVAMTNSTISNNSSANGGGFHLLSSNLTIENSIVSGNHASSSLGHEFHLVSASTFISESTVSETSQNLFGESSRLAASAFYGYVPDSETITASSDGTNPTSLGSILDSAASHDTADGAGTTYAHALVQDSPALSAADTSTCANTDQRGEARDTTSLLLPIRASNGSIAVITLGGDCDLGSYESNL